MLSEQRMRCSHPKVVRRSRSGLLDALMFKLGRYPWTCRMCGQRLYSRDRHPSDREAAARTGRFVIGK